MERLKNDLLTEKYTYVEFERNEKNVPTKFQVCQSTREDGNPNSIVGTIQLQSGAIKESGVNGVMGEDLIAMVLVRLEEFQNTEFRCRENACAITKLEEAMMWLRKRTNGRENRGVEGTYKV